MTELLAHLFGDFVFQNQVMADRKKVSHLWCLIHVTIYSLFFIPLVESWQSLFVIWGTHFLIDRYSLVSYWMNFYGNGFSGTLVTKSYEFRRLLWTIEQIHEKLEWMEAHDSGKWNTFKTKFYSMKDDLYEEYDKNHEIVSPAPTWLRSILAIIIDNTFHLAINHFAIIYL